jgi:hypothetical protein
MRGVGQRNGGRGAAQLFHHDAMGEIAQARATAVLRHGQPQDPELSEFGPEVGWKVTSAVCLFGERCHPLRGEPADRFAQRIHVGAQGETKTSPIHLSCTSCAWRFQ